MRHHLDPEAAVAAFDQDELPQLRAENLRYAQDETAKALAVWRANGGQPLAATDSTVNDVVAFLHALTDPCMLSRTCLAPWIPASNTAAPDGERLEARVPESVAD